MDKENAAKGHRGAGHRNPRADAARLSRIQEPGPAGPGAIGVTRSSSTCNSARKQQREIVFKDITTGEVDPYHDSGHRRRGGLPQRHRLFRPDDHEGPAPGQRLRRALRQGQSIRPRESIRPDRRIWKTPNTLRNLSELPATKTIIEGFKKAINALTVQDKGNAEIRDSIKLRQTRPFVAKEQGYLVPKKSVFNRIIGDSGFELRFASFLDECERHRFLRARTISPWVSSWITSMPTATFPITTRTFSSRSTSEEIFIVETKGREDLDVPLKMARLKQWCEDINRAQSDVRYDFVYVDEEGFKKYRPATFADVVRGFREYKD